MKTVTVNQAARIKGVSRQAINSAIRAGKLETVTVEMPHTRIVVSSLKKYEPNPSMKRAGRKPVNGNKRSKSRKET